MNNQKDIIGGEFRIDPYVLQSEIRNDLTPNFSLGRTCLYGILDCIQHRIEGVLFPDYVCNSVTEVPARLGISMKHYHITLDFDPDVDSLKEAINEFRGNCAILLISYFGMVDLNAVISILRTEYRDVFIIVDDVQNYYGFGKNCDFDYCFTSYRKWFAVPDGAEVLRKKTMPEIESYLPQADYVWHKAAGNLLKNYKYLIGDSISLELIDRGEAMMDEEYRFRCSDFSLKLIQRIDTKLIAERRKTNAEFLHKRLKHLNIQHLYDSTSVPLFIPIVVEERDKIRRKLFEDEIFVPIHWPIIDSVAQGNNQLYKTELSLICDQRYDENDMERIVRGIENAM